MFIKTYTGTLVNLDKIVKIDRAAVGNGALGMWELRAWFNDSRVVILFTGTKSDTEIAKDNLEEAILTNAKILSYYHKEED